MLLVYSMGSANISALASRLDPFLLSLYPVSPYLTTASCSSSHLQNDTPLHHLRARKLYRDYSIKLGHNTTYCLTAPRFNTRMRPIFMLCNSTSLFQRWAQDGSNIRRLDKFNGTSYCLTSTDIPTIKSITTITSSSTQTDTSEITLQLCESDKGINANGDMLDRQRFAVNEDEGINSYYDLLCWEWDTVENRLFERTCDHNEDNQIMVLGVDAIYWNT